MPMYKVYIHVFPNNKKYVGITSRSLQERWCDGKHYSGAMKNAVNKYGWKNIKHFVYKQELTEEQAKLKEKEFIAKYKTMDSRYGYNLTAGGDGSCGYKHTAETKEKMKLHHHDVSGENNPFYGKSHTVETRKALSESNTGKKLSQETKDKISRSMSGKNHPLYGKHFSETSKRKMSESHKGQGKGQKFSEEHKAHLSEAIRKSWETRSRKFSDEVRKNMSLGQRKRHMK